MVAALLGLEAPQHRHNLMPLSRLVRSPVAIDVGNEIFDVAGPMMVRYIEGMSPCQWRKRTLDRHRVPRIIRKKGVCCRAEDGNDPLVLPDEPSNRTICL